LDRHHDKVAAAATIRPTRTAWSLASTNVHYAKLVSKPTEMIETTFGLAVGLYVVLLRNYLGRLLYEAVGRKQDRVEHYQQLALWGGLIGIVLSLLRLFSLFVQ
jgi:hypothetical protein